MPNPHGLSDSQYQHLLRFYRPEEVDGFSDRQLQALGLDPRAGIQLSAPSAPSAPVVPRPIGKISTDYPTARRDFVLGAGREERDEAEAVASDYVTMTQSQSGVPMPLTDAALRVIEERAMSDDMDPAGNPFARAVATQRGESEDIGGQSLLSPFYWADMAGSMAPQQIADEETTVEKRRQRQRAQSIAKQIIQNDPQLELTDETINHFASEILGGRLPADAAEARVALLLGANQADGLTPQRAGDLFAEMSENTTRPRIPGRLTESTPLWMLRMMSAPTSAAVGALDPTTSVPERIVEGEGFVAGGRDLYTAAARALGLPEEMVVWAGRSGAGLGLMAEFMVPLDLGIADTAKAVRLGSGSFKAAKGAGATTEEAARLAASRAFIPERWNTANGRLARMIADSDEVGAAVDDAFVALNKRPTVNPHEVELPANATQAERDLLESQLQNAPETPHTLDDVIQTEGLSRTFASGDDFLDSLRQRGILTADATKAVKQLEAPLQLAALKEQLKPIVEVGTRAHGQRLGSPEAAQKAALASAVGRRRIGLIEDRASTAGLDARTSKVRVTQDLVAERGAARKIFQDFKSTPIGRVSAELGRTGSKHITPEGRVNLISVLDDLEIPLADFVNQMLVRASNARYSPSAVERMRTQGVLGPLDSSSLKDYNTRVGSAFRRHALESGDVQQISTRAAPGQEAVAADAIPVDAEELSRLLTPRELRPGKVRGFIETSMGTKKAQAAQADQANEAMRPLIQELAEGWGSIDRQFYQELRNAPGKNKPEKFAHVLSGAYDTPRQMVLDVVSNYFGGYESLGKLIQSTSGESMAKKLTAATPSTIRKEVTAAFAALSKDPPAPGTATEVQQTMLDLLRVMQSPTMNPTLVAESLIQGLRKLEGKPLSELGVTAPQASKVTPIFQRQQIVDCLASSYYQRRSGSILRDVFSPERIASVGGPLGKSAPEVIAGLRNQLNTTLDRLGRRLLTEEDTARLLALEIGDDVTRAAGDVSGLSLARRSGRGDPDLVEVEHSFLPRPAGFKHFLDLGYSPQQVDELFESVEQYHQTLKQTTDDWTQQNVAIKRYIDLFFNQQLVGPKAGLEELRKAGTLSTDDIGTLLHRLDHEAITTWLEQNAKATRKTQQMLDNVDPSDPLMSRFLRTSMEILSDLPRLADRGGFARWVKGGMLSGRLFPNMLYMGMNFFTAPAIVLQTLGSGPAAKALSRVIPWDLRLNRAVSYFYGYGDPMAIVASSATGQVWTAADLAPVLSRLTSQTGYELNEEAIRSMRAASGLSSSKVAEGAMGLDAMAQSPSRQFIREWTGLDVERVSGQRMPDVSVEVNVFNEAAQASDMYFRVGVLLDALSEGRAMDEAVELANASLFDYNAVSSLERSTVARAVWFWSFRRESLRSTATMLLENPNRLRALYQAKKAFEYDTRENVMTKEYMELRPVMKWIEDPATQERYAIVGPAVPMFDAFAELVDYSSSAALIASDILYIAMGYDADPTSLRTGGTGPSSMPRRLKDTVSERVHRLIMEAGAEVSPFYQALIEHLGVKIFGGDARQMSGYLDPKWMAIGAMNPEWLPGLTSFFNIEPVPITERKPGAGTFQGEQWRVQESEGNLHAWSVFQYAMMALGVQRTLRDYAPLFFKAWNAGDIPEDTPFQVAPGLVDNVLLDELLRQFGFATAVDIDPVHVKRRKVLRGIQYDLGDETPQ